MEIQSSYTTSQIKLWYDQQLKQHIDAAFELVDLGVGCDDLQWENEFFLSGLLEEEDRRMALTKTNN
jgi:hypothetical protein